MYLRPNSDYARTAVHLGFLQPAHSSLSSTRALLLSKDTVSHKNTNLEPNQINHYSVLFSDTSVQRHASYWE